MNFWWKSRRLWWKVSFICIRWTAWSLRWVGAVMVAPFKTWGELVTHPGAWRFLHDWTFQCSLAIVFASVWSWPCGKLGKRSLLLRRARNWDLVFNSRTCHQRWLTCLRSSHHQMILTGRFVWVACLSRRMVMETMWVMSRITCSFVWLAIASRPDAVNFGLIMDPVLVALTGADLELSTVGAKPLEIATAHNTSPTFLSIPHHIIGITAWI